MHAKILGTVSIVLACVAARPALGQTAQECATHFEEGQSKRASRDLVAAKKDFIACSQLACPEVIVRECIQRVSDLERDLPTVGFRVTDGKGRELFDVEVAMDDQVLTQKLDGSSFELNPGIHKFRFTAPDFETLESSVSVLEGERGRVLQISLESALPEPEAAPPVSAPPPAPARPAPSSEPGFRVPTFTWIAAGVSVAALGSFAYFRLSGASDYDDLQNRCEPNCSEGEIDPVRRKYMISTVSLAVSGAAFVAAGLTLWLGQPQRSSPEAGSIGLRLAPNGVAVRGLF